MANFARQTGAYVIAEGIEDEDTLAFLRSIDDLGRAPPEDHPGWPGLRPRQTVPITNTLRRHLQSHRLHQGTGGHGLVFPNHRGDKPFNPSTTNQRAKEAWAAKGLTPISLHECRHSYAAYMIAAGINTKALSTYMGHASITITLDRYGHLLPGNEHQAAGLLESFLQASNT
jgi:integrase